MQYTHLEVRKQVEDKAQREREDGQIGRARELRQRRKTQ